MRKRYIVEVERSADDHVEGFVTRDDHSEPMPFHGWIEFLSLLERPLPAELESGPDAQRTGAR